MFTLPVCETLPTIVEMRALAPWDEPTPVQTGDVDALGSAWQAYDESPALAYAVATFWGKQLAQEETARSFIKRTWQQLVSSPEELSYAEQRILTLCRECLNVSKAEEKSTEITLIRLGNLYIAEAKVAYLTATVQLLFCDDPVSYVIPEALRYNKDVMLRLILRSGLALQAAAPALQDDKEVVLIAVKQNSAALQFASKTLRGDRDVVLAALGS